MAKVEPIQFLSDGLVCRGDLHTPDGDGPYTTVIMAHGFGLTRHCGLEPFRDAFLAAGYAVFQFDYRHFGDSEGMPRQLLLPGKQVADWHAAILCMRKREDVDTRRIVLWGTSFAGGLVTVVAARDPGIAAIIAQCPMMDGLASVLELMRYAGAGQGVKLTAAGLWDTANALLGQPAKTIPSAGRPGEVAAMTSHDAYDGYTALMPEGVPNEVAARAALVLPLFRPVRHAAKVICPALIQICTQDTVAPASAAEKAAARMPMADVIRYDTGHFDIYQGAERDKSIADQVAFIDRQVV